MKPPDVARSLWSRWPLFAGGGLIVLALVLVDGEDPPRSRPARFANSHGIADPSTSARASSEPGAHVVRLSRQTHGFHLGAMDPGGNIAAVLLIENDTSERVASLSFQDAGCSCEVPSGWLPALEPGSSFQVELVQRFQTYDYEQSRFRLVDTTGRIWAEIGLAADVAREPLLATPVRYLGRIGPADVVEAELIVIAPPEAFRADAGWEPGVLAPEVELRGELEGFLSLEPHPQDLTSLRYHGSVRPRPGFLGALRAEVSLRIGASEVRALVLADVWPGGPGAPGDLPRVVLGGGEPDDLVVELGGFEIHSAGWEAVRGEAPWPISFEREGRTRIRFRHERSEGPADSRSAHRRLILETDRGRVLLTVVDADVPLPEELLVPPRLLR